MLKDEISQKQHLIKKNLRELKLTKQTHDKSCARHKIQ